MKCIPVVVAVIAAFLVASCERTDEEMGDAPSGKTTITLSIETPSEVTRATQAEESTIKTLTAYVFVADGKSAAGTWVPTTTRITASGTSTTAMITVDPAYAFTAANNKVDIYLMANATVPQLPDDNTARTAFLAAGTRGFDNQATGSNFHGLQAMSYVRTVNITSGSTTEVPGNISLKRTQARVFVSNTQVVGNRPNQLQGYTIAFSGLADRAIPIDEVISRFIGVGSEGTYTCTAKGTNGQADFYYQEPVGYLYPTPANKTVTVTVKNPGNTATKVATFTPVAGMNYQLKITPGTTNATLRVAVEQWRGEEKYMVVLVAGQSNSVGYDECAAELQGIDKIDPNAFQLGYKGANNLDIIPLTWCAQNLVDMSTINKGTGAKGIHLPLAKELLKPGRLPRGYKVLVIPVATGGSSFVAGYFGRYDAALMRPVEMGAALRWGPNSPNVKTMIDRVKYALNLNPENKFLGVVWCQGESDAAQSKPQYEAFKQMTQVFFDGINVAHANRCPKGTADKDLWYSHSSTHFWHDWYVPQYNASTTFGGYKVWNPNTFVHVPKNTLTNTTNNIGVGTTNHFGNNAYALTIAPMVVQCMDENGGLFNGKPKVSSNRFVETDIKQNAATLGGSLADADVQNGLRFFYSFASGTVNTDYNNVSVRAYARSMNLIDAPDLVDVKGESRRRKVLNVPSGGGALEMRCLSNPVTGDWSMAFLIKRTSNLGAPVQPIIYGLGITPFIGYKTYTGSVNDELVADNVEFVVERNATTDRSRAVPGQFIDADNVRTMNQWIHYVITFDSNTNMMCIYANGQRITQKALGGFQPTDFSRIFIGTTDMYTITSGLMMADLGLWNSVLPDTAIKKLYLYGYYGYSK